MIDAISAWIKNIILLVLFASFLELLLPTSSMQRFIRVIIGLFIMLAILNPVIDIIQNRWFNEQIPALSTNSTNSETVLNKANMVAGERERLSYDIYKKELAKQIRATVIAIEGVADAQIAVEFDRARNGSSTGMPQNITVYVKPGIGAGDGKVAKVTIGNSSSSEQTELKPQLKNKITYTIYELYQIPKEHIEIKLLHQ